ncbi:sensor histidine kinase [Hymenobacter sp. BT491]|uniref:sensor histidine kinase n=1 Tax=Hymenobacter sp. BT491 TaxID=2766779 RepID=UPI00165354C1|nr:histidine kinase [Hymenobacter sp. BT491]MBC6988647.1 histidine kinase [Hymenobacter sp. BT491]
MPALSRRTRLYWSLQLGGWIAFGALGVAMYSIFGRFMWLAVRLEACVVLTMLALSHALREYVRRHAWVTLPADKLLPRLLGALGVVSVVSQLIIATLVVYVVRPPAAVGGPAPWYQYIGYGLQIFVVMLIWSGLYFGVHYLDRYKQVEIDKLKLAVAVRDAEMRTLKAQINPHFMFNGLNNIRALVTEDPSRARQMITHLSDLLRYSIQLNSTEQVPLARELEIVEHYLELEAVQLEERLAYSLDVEPAALDVLIPPMTLQLLVENSIKHGIAPRPEGGQITLTARCDEAQEALYVTVSNTGTYETDSTHEGVGLRNARERLHLLFGPKAVLAIDNDSVTPNTVTACLRLPLIPQPHPA